MNFEPPEDMTPDEILLELAEILVATGQNQDHLPAKTGPPAGLRRTTPAKS